MAVCLSAPWSRCLLFSVSVSSCFCLSHVSLCFPPVREPNTGFRTHLNDPGCSPHLKILNLIRPPRKVTFTGSRDWDMGVALGVEEALFKPLHPLIDAEFSQASPNLINSKSKAHPPCGVSSCVCLERLERMVDRSPFTYGWTL